MPTNPQPWRRRRDSTVALRGLVLACLLGCDAAPERADRGASSQPISTATAAASAAATPLEPAATAGARASSSAPGDLSGSWIGSYDARKGTVGLPPKVKDKALAADDGKAAVGPGSIEITVLPGGDVRGKMSGALGDGAIVGRVEGSTLRAAIRPQEPPAANAMTGVLIGERKGEVIPCELRVASPDATVVRQAVVELKRKP